MEPELKANLRTVFDLFVSAPGAPAMSTIWARAVGDGRFLERIEAGSGLTVRSYDRAVRWFFDHWPADLAWPEHIKVPTDPIPARRSRDTANATAAE